MRGVNRFGTAGIATARFLPTRLSFTARVAHALAIVGLLLIGNRTWAGGLSGDVCLDDWLTCHCLTLYGMKPNTTFPMTMEQTQPGVLGFAPGANASVGGAMPTLTLDVTTDENGTGCLGAFTIYGTAIGRSDWYAHCDSCLPGGAGYTTGHYPVEVFSLDPIEVIPMDTPITADNPDWAGGGLRIFPDATSPTDAVDRRKVKIRTVVHSVTPNRPVRLIGWDYDDPSSDPDVDLDGPAQWGNDNSFFDDSKFEGSQSSSGRVLDLTADAGGVVEGVFFVSQQPGDNYQFQAVSQRPYEWGCHVLSEPLTVWRNLHVEVDSMAAVNSNTVSGLVTLVDKNQTTLTIKPSPPQALKDGRFQNGHIYIKGIGDFVTAGNSTDRKGTTKIKLKDALPQKLPSLPVEFRLVDDDDMFQRFVGFPLLLDGDEGLDVPPPSLELLEDSDDPAKNAFAAAYIRPRYDVGDDNQAVPFLLNAPGSFDRDGSLINRDEVRSTYDFDAAEGASANFWTVYLLGAYQATPEYDGDPDAATLVGLTDGEQGAHVYEAAYGEQILMSKGLRPEQTAPHELGHLFWGDHSDGGLMAPALDPDRRASFTGKTLRRIRDTLFP